MSLEDKIGRFGKWAKRGLEIAVVVAGVACMAEQCDIKFKRPNPIKVTHFADQRGDESNEFYIPLDAAHHFNNTRPEYDPLTYSVQDFTTVDVNVIIGNTVQTMPMIPVALEPLEGDTIHIYASNWHGTQEGKVQACDTSGNCNSARLTVNFNGPIVEPLFNDVRGSETVEVYVSDVMSHFSGDTAYDPLDVSVLDFDTADVPIYISGNTIGIGPSDWHGIQTGNVQVCDSDTTYPENSVCIKTPLKVIFNSKPVLEMVVDTSSELEPLSGQVFCDDLDDDTIRYGLMDSTLPEVRIIYGGTDGAIFSCIDGDTTCTPANPDPLPRGAGGPHEIDACCSDGLETVCYSDQPVGKSLGGPLEFDVNKAPVLKPNPIMTVSREGAYLAGRLDVSDGDAGDVLTCDKYTDGGLTELVVNPDCTITSGDTGTEPIGYTRAGSYMFSAWVSDGVVTIPPSGAPPIYVTLVIANTNRAPDITDVVINQTPPQEDGIMTGSISRTDEDGDYTTCSLVSSTLPQVRVTSEGLIYSCTSEPCEPLSPQPLPQGTSGDQTLEVKCCDVPYNECSTTYTKPYHVKNTWGPTELPYQFDSTQGSDPAFGWFDLVSWENIYSYPDIRALFDKDEWNDMDLTMTRLGNGNSADWEWKDPNYTAVGVSEDTVFYYITNPITGQGEYKGEFIGIEGVELILIK